MNSIFNSKRFNNLKSYMNAGNNGLVVAIAKFAMIAKSNKHYI